MIETRFRIPRRGFTLDVAESFPAQGVTAIFGPSGCGKTTWLRAIAGLERTPDGLCRVNGQTWQDGGHFTPPHRRALACVFQDAALFPHLDVRQNLLFGYKRTPESARRVSFDETVETLGLAHLLRRAPASLSGGEAQRVAIARALLASPGLLLMDEPMAALDGKARADILALLEDLRARLSIPVVYVSHSRVEVARLADHLVLMDKGRVRACGPLTQLVTRLDIAADEGAQAAAIIEARVAGHDEKWHLTYLDFPGGRFQIARASRPEGSTARLRVLARDVSLTLKPQTGTSILNIFPATVTEMTRTGPAQMLARLDLAGAPLLAGITRKSAAALKLAPGRAVYAQIKAVALL